MTSSDDEDNTAPLQPLHAGRPILPDRADAAPGFGPVLRRRDFRFLWAAQVASQLADKFLMFTVLVVVYELSGQASAPSLLMVAYTLPSVLLSAPAGVYADRHDKKLLMLGANLIRGALILLIPLVASIPGLAHQVWPLLVITLLFSSAGQVFAPAEAASIPSLVRTDEIMVATSLFMTTVILTLVLGVPAATLSIKVFGSHAPFFIATALFVVAAGCVWQVRTSLHAGRRVSSHLLDELREGLAILKNSPPLRAALAQLTVALVVVFTIFALGPAYMAKALHRPSEDTYLLLIPATFGMVGMAAALGQRAIHLSRARALVGGLACGGGALVVIGLAPGLLERVNAVGLLVPVTVVLALFFGAALGSLLIPAFTVLQEQTTPQTRGRIFGGIFTVINAAIAVPLVVAGGLADAWGVEAVMAGLGAILVLGAVGARTIFWASLGSLERPIQAKGSA